MILKASQRSGARNLAAHLLNAKANEMVELHELRGLVAEGDLTAALVEMDAQASGTRARKPLFSVSFNPPEKAEAGTRDFEEAFATVEKQFELENQPRAVVFHEKEGRRHAHVVWSLIDTERGKALEVKFYKNRLMEIARDLYLEHGWKLPEGLKRDRRNKEQDFTRGENDFNLSDVQRMERAGLTPDAFKKMVKETYDRSDSRKAFEAAIAEKGLYLAKGDRGFCLVDAAGGIYALPRQTGYKKKDIEKRFGDPESLPTVKQVQAVIERRKMAERFRQNLEELKIQQGKQRETLRERYKDLIAQQRAQRETLQRRQWRRTVEEERARAERLRGGVTRFFDRITKLKDRLLGREDGTQKVIAKERETSRRRDLGERDALLKEQRRERWEQRRERWEQRRERWEQRREAGLMKQRQREEQENLREQIMSDVARDEGHREAIRNAGREREGRDEERTEEKATRRQRASRRAGREQANDNTREMERSPEVSLTLER